ADTFELHLDLDESVWFLRGYQRIGLSVEQKQAKSQREGGYMVCEGKLHFLWNSFSVWGCFFFQAEDGIRDFHVTGVQTCALPILHAGAALDRVQARQDFDVGGVVAGVHAGERPSWQVLRWRAGCAAALGRSSGAVRP